MNISQLLTKLKALIYSKSETDSLLGGKANSSHTHTKSQITDFPSYGNTAGTICQGNDARLSDARTPTSHTHTKSQITDFPSLATVATSGSYNDLSNKPNRNLLQTNGATSLGWSGIGGVANGSTLQIKTTDNTAPSICFHRSGYSHVVLLEQSGQLLVQQQGGTTYRVNHDGKTTLNGYQIYVG